MDIARLLQPYVETLSDTQLAQVSTYLDLLLRWNARTNLTAIRDPAQIVTRHFGESFFLASKLFGLKALGYLDIQITRCPDVLDLGSGAGFPAIPLLVFRPDITITLVEAHHTKAVFLREVLRALHLEAEVQNVRAEALPPASADIVTLRAVEKFDSILPTAANLVRSVVMEAGRPRPAITDFNQTPIPYPPSRFCGLALLISSPQISRARQVLLTWHFHPEIPIPNSQNRVVQLIEPK
ncbi:MAG TPA: 16S rRNA (guanine(527)-N(7))-methyltransferase RsmG [Terriglobales bacterium]|nr:16S rRNA (guanine(527)-N(7))-methyltransferase RsmG [Terriglobales bacterium]